MARGGSKVYWTEERVLAEIKRVIAEAQKLGVRPKIVQVKGGAKAWVGVYFGGFKNALLAAGYNPIIAIEESDSRRTPRTLANGDNYTASLCWDCKNAYAHRCSWFACGKMPDKAVFEERRTKESNRHKSLAVYACVSCPNFVYDEGKPNTKLDDEGAQRLIFEIVKSAAKELRMHNNGDCSAKRFFESDWFKELTGMDGNELVGRVCQRGK